MLDTVPKASLWEMLSFVCAQDDVDAGFLILDTRYSLSAESKAGGEKSFVVIGWSSNSNWWGQVFFEGVNSLTTF